MEITIHPNLPDLYRRKVSRLQRLLDDEETRSQAVEIIRSLIDRIEVHPGQERGNCEVIIVGALAQILAFAQQKNNRRLLGRRRYVLDGCGGSQPPLFALSCGGAACPDLTAVWPAARFRTQLTSLAKAGETAGYGPDTSLRFAFRTSGAPFFGREWTAGRAHSLPQKQFLRLAANHTAPQPLACHWLLRIAPARAASASEGLRRRKVQPALALGDDIVNRHQRVLPVLGVRRGAKPRPERRGEGRLRGFGFRRQSRLTLFCAVQVTPLSEVWICPR